VTILISNKLVLISAIIIVSVVSTTLLYILSYGGPPIASRTATNSGFQNISSVQSEAYTNVTTVEDHMYRFAVEDLKNFLEEARDIYLNSLRNNGTRAILIYEPYSNLSKMFILNTTIVNETTLSIDHTAYRYMVVHVYDAESRQNFMPQRIQINSMLIELLPKNKSITYTGMTPYDYLVSYESNSYKVSFLSTSFVEASYYLTVSTDRVNNNIYKVRITVAKELGSAAYISVAWLILMKNG